MTLSTSPYNQSSYQQMLDFFQQSDNAPAVSARSGAGGSVLRAQDRISLQQAPGWAASDTIRPNNAPVLREYLTGVVKQYLASLVQGWLGSAVASGAAGSAAAGAAAGGAASWGTAGAAAGTSLGAAAASAGIGAAVVGAFVTGKNGAAMRAQKGGDLNDKEAIRAGRPFKGEPWSQMLLQSKTMRTLDKCGLSPLPFSSSIAKFLANNLFHVSTKEYQAARTAQLEKAVPSYKTAQQAISEQTDFYKSQRNKDASVDAFGEKFVGYDPTTGQWINNAFVKTGDPRYVRPEDVMGSHLSFELYGDKLISSDPLEQRVAAQAMINVGVKSKYGMIYPRGDMSREEYAAKVDAEVARIKNDPALVAQVKKELETWSTAATLSTILRIGQGGNPNRPEDLKAKLTGVLQESGQPIPNVLSDYPDHVAAVLNGQISKGISGAHLGIVTQQMLAASAVTDS